MDEAAKRHIYTSSFSDFYYTKMKQSEKTVRKDDLLFCGAPHLFIAHEKCVGKWAEDSKVNCNLATAYFELIANAFGLGTVIMSYPSDVLAELAPEAEKLIGIPENHYRKLIVGFGYPEIPYARGVQKDRSPKIHRYTDKNSFTDRK
jgi:nitroreductase